jgi:xanthine/CO dehydrogenase XdhC/CoxF family maturation factor
MLVNITGGFSGSVSAGCLEEEIARTAIEVLRTNQPRLLTIDTRPHYGCPGQITLLLEILAPPHAAALFKAIHQHLLQRSSFTLATDYRELPGDFPATRVVSDTKQPHAASKILHQIVEPCPQVIVVGAGDDAQALAKTALLAKWTVHTVNPTDFQFAPQSLSARYPADARTAIVLMTHNLGHDAACLDVVLREPYGYIGVIGSGKRRRELITALETTGNPTTLSRLDGLFCPAGLDLGAGEAGEIAISILAEIQSVWSGRDARSLRLRATPIHQHG